MSRSKEIYTIVKTFDRGQKRSVSSILSKYEKDKKSALKSLFDIYDKLAQWDDERFKIQTEKAGLGKSVSVLNNQLLEKLLLSLRESEKHRDPIFSINKFLEDAKILFQYELYSLALKKVGEARKLAEEKENFSRLSDICKIEKSILFRTLNRKKYQAYLKQHYQEIKMIHQTLENGNRFQQWADKIFSYYRTHGEAQSEEVRQHYLSSVLEEEFNSVDKALSIKAKSSYYFVRSLCYKALDDQDKVEKAINGHLYLFESNPQYIPGNLDEYLAMLNNAILIYSDLDKGDKMVDTIKKVRNLPTEFSLDSPYLDRRVFETSYPVELDFYLKNHELEKASEIVPVIEKMILKYADDGWSMDRYLGLTLGLALYHFHKNEFELAYDWNCKVINSELAVKNFQVHVYSRFLDLILHVQMKNWLLFDSRQQALNRLLLKFNYKPPVCQVLFSCLRQLNNTTQQISTSRKKQWIKEIEEVRSSPEKLFLEKYVRLYHWIQNRH